MRTIAVERRPIALGPIALRAVTVERRPIALGPVTLRTIAVERRPIALGPVALRAVTIERGPITLRPVTLGTVRTLLVTRGAFIAEGRLLRRWTRGFGGRFRRADFDRLCSGCRRLGGGFRCAGLGRGL